MAVAIVGTPDTTHANGDSYTAEAGSNRMLLFAGASVDTNQLPMTGDGTFGGVSLAEAVEVISDYGVRQGILRGSYLLEASIPATAQVSAFTADSTLENPFEGGVLTLSGVDQTTPIPATGVDNIALDGTDDTLNFAAPAGCIAFLISQHLGETMNDPAGWTLLSTYAPMTNGTQLKTWQRAFASADGAATVTLTAAEVNSGAAAVFCVAQAAAAGTTVEPDDIEQAQSLDAPALTQTHVLTPGNLAQSQAFDATAITQDHQLPAGDIAQAQVVDAPSLSAEHQVEPGEIAQTQAFDAPSVTQDHQLPVGDIAQEQVTEAPTLEQTHALAVADMVQMQSLDAASLIVAGTVTPADIAQIQNLGAVIITQDHQLTVADLAQLQALDAPTADITHSLTVSGIAQAQALDAVTLIITGQLAPLGIAQLQALEAGDIVQTHVLPVSDIVQLQVLGAPTGDGAPSYLIVTSIRLLPAINAELSAIPALHADLSTLPALSGTLTLKPN